MKNVVGRYAGLFLFWGCAASGASGARTGSGPDAGVPPFDVIVAPLPSPDIDCVAETCDGADNDCDGVIDEDAERVFFEDKDGDGYASNGADSYQGCDADPGYVLSKGDCDDSDTWTHPGAAEYCGRDRDCDGTPAVACDGLLGTGALHGCAVQTDGTVDCWGGNQYGALGDGTADLTGAMPVVRLTHDAVVGLADARAISVDGATSCVIRSSGRVACWGLNARGMLGDGASSNASAPIDVAGLRNATQLDVGGASVCARTGDGTAWCWGANSAGQLGAGTTAASSVAVRVALEAPIAQVAVGLMHACAQTSAGQVYCWGDSQFGQLGGGTTDDAWVPVQVPGLSDVTAVAAGPYHSCALRREGSVACWGWNANGQLGHGTTGTSLVPVNVYGLDDAVAIASSAVGIAQTTCAVTQRGSVMCWGQGSTGQLGNGASSDSTIPVAMPGLDGIQGVQTGARTCAIRADGAVFCAGQNTFGQLGDGTTTSVLSPVEVRAFQ